MRTVPPTSKRTLTMTYPIRSLLLTFLAAALLAAPSPALAQSARSFLEGRHEEVIRVLRQPAQSDAARQQRSERLTRMLNGLLDYEALSQASLGEHWDSQSAAERERFATLLRQLVERNYEDNLERIVDYEVSYDAERRRGEHTIVTTTARSRQNRREPAVTIEYTLIQRDGQWRVVDVATDGVSMVSNYRNQFARIIDREGWSELITRMERRLEES